ncbi:MAG: hypothetical protein CVU89_00260 [Firmicutes bacterium HGW-Firmicutes-14]|nr:MAG: hypothetical protein CVU89_00260 [Firmicutes bacterium HGW-Firmicutes-14]
MQVDSSVFMGILLNIGLLLAFSWFGIRLLESGCFKSAGFDGHTAELTSKIINESAVILPRLKISIFRIRRMIKTNTDNDEPHFCLPQLS